MPKSSCHSGRADGRTRGNTNVIAKNIEDINELIELVQELDDHLNDMYTSLDRVRPLLSLIAAQGDSPTTVPLNSN